MRDGATSWGNAFTAALAGASLALCAQCAMAAPAALTPLGSGGLDQGLTGQATGSVPETPPSMAADVPPPAHTDLFQGTMTKPVSPRLPRGFLGAQGLNHHDERTADSGNQFSLEPPDQALCVGNDFVMEAVNQAVRVRSADTNLPVSGVTALNRFYGLPSAINRTTGVRGPFLSDPKCVYDTDTRRFYMTVLAEATGAANGPLSPRHAYVLIAVSKSNDPTKGFAIFALDVTNDGVGGVFGNTCPCFGDQPLIGLDKNGLFISTNAFGSSFGQAQIYGISKQKLAAAAAGASVSLSVGYINTATLPTPEVGGYWYSVQPAKSTPNDDDQEFDVDSSGHHGVEYFLSALDLNGTGDRRVALWALTNTDSLQTSSPALFVQTKVISTSTFYIQPNSMSQKGSAGLIQSNDDRMNQVVKYNNTLYGAVNTGLSDPSGSTVGVAYWGIKPSWRRGVLDGNTMIEGTVSVARNSVAYPSIALDRDGEGMMAFSLIGPDYYPSAAFVRFRHFGGAIGPVVIAAAGVAPDIGFTVPLSAAGGRWGDYSAAADEKNRVWAAAEYIPVASFGAAANGGLANWGTFIWRLTPSNGDE